MVATWTPIRSRADHPYQPPEGWYDAAPRFLLGTDLPVDQHRAHTQVFLYRFTDIRDARCWRWVKPHDERFTPLFSFGSRRIPVQVFAYVWRVGPVPDTLVPRPVCGGELCVRPEHLRLRRRQRLGPHLSPGERAAIAELVHASPIHQELGTADAIARAYGVLEAEVWKIANDAVQK